MTQDTQTSKTSHICDAVVEAAGDPAGIVEDMMDAKWAALPRAQCGANCCLHSVVIWVGFCFEASKSNQFIHRQLEPIQYYLFISISLSRA